MVTSFNSSKQLHVCAICTKALDRLPGSFKPDCFKILLFYINIIANPFFTLGTLFRKRRPEHVVMSGTAAKNI